MVLKSLRKIKTEIVCPPKVGEIIEGKIVNRGRSSVFLDLAAKGIGIIYGKEFFRAKGILKDLKIGDSVCVKVVNLENEEGFRELSLTEADQELAWDDLKKKKEEGEIFEVQVKGANKGGLVCEIRGIPGFLPASQLLPEHYPKVEGAEPSKIAKALQKFVGENLKIKIFDVDLREKKLILSEKATKTNEQKAKLSNYKTGNAVEGEITGVTNFGAFIRFGEDLEGLIHSSEISKSDSENPKEVLKVGQKVKAKIIEIVNNRVYLSLRDFAREGKPKAKPER